MNKSIIKDRIKKSFNNSDGWRSRGCLPHFDRPDIYQFITFRLYDSLPAEKIRQIKSKIEIVPVSKHSEYKFKFYEKFMDQGYGACYLAQPEIAEMVVSSFKYYDQINYKLYSYVIMPNHVHLLLKILPGFYMAGTIRKIKSYTSYSANKILSRSGKFWSEEYHDRYIRDLNHYESVKFYILNNPVKAGLVGSAKNWKYSWAE